MERFQRLAISGETGSGKTTLLKMIAGLTQSDGGEALFNNERVLGPLEKLLPGHPKIAYLSQHFELRNNLRVSEVLEMAVKLSPGQSSTIYEICRIAHLLHRRTDQISGGERQRIALARVLSTSPELLLLDEPYSNLDFAHKAIIKSVIDDIGSRLGISCLLVSQDPLDILSWAEHVIVLKDGRIIQQGIAEEIYHRPINEYVAGLFGEYTLLSHPTFGIPIEKNKPLFTRPSYFSLNNPSQRSEPGTIRYISFFGNYYLLQIELRNQLITATSTDPSLQIGTTVSVTLNHSDIWTLLQS